MLSAVVLTKNEEKNIKKCLESLSFCDEVLVIDDYSSDKIVQLAKSQGAKVFKQVLRGDFAAQRNFGLSKARGEWVLFVDADEIVSSALAEEIASNIQHPTSSTNGFYFRRKDKFLGRWLKYGETSHVRLLRLGRKNAGKWQGKVHEIWQVKGKKKTLKNPLLHKRDLTTGQFLARLNFYSSIRAEQLYQQGIKTNIFLVTLYPLAKFFQNYFFHLGFLDGTCGFIFAMMMSLHSFLVRGKLWMMWRNQGRKEFTGVKVGRLLIGNYG